MTIGERIKIARKAAGYTQQAFADKLGLKRNTIAGYEIGTVAPSDRTIADICQRFDIKEQWLRTGEGEMIAERSRDEEIAAFIGEVANDADDSFRRRLISVLSRLSVEEWKLIEKMALDLVEETKKD